ncbi:asparaginyl-tRNA synthetase (NOB+tRNA synthase) [Toxoplasma gondii ME49]|uniref:asparagine--tRNA ligase n=2 Tax=Toxoplasma gondii TaxID=5811 RepID=S8EYC0_TOXGM|nr:asparaginyl-tRNA synthetase (NOB+tRNA synthase) [Toxoplasma gondii ME49]EPT28421.1 asparaginyl-tRNA synthetase (NOB+tRNA synthase) [Toxoplasma gondii ME49]|eukprot:XP_002365717.1 asparaginyl-tRNA synthetase (NOB+tRNA synthase) [Toxoplasma gondii ME49]
MPRRCWQLFVCCSVREFPVSVASRLLLPLLFVLASARNSALLYSSALTLRSSAAPLAFSSAGCRFRGPLHRPWFPVRLTPPDQAYLSRNSASGTSPRSIRQFPVPSGLALPTSVPLCARTLPPLSRHFASVGTMAQPQGESKSFTPGHLEDQVPTSCKQAIPVFGCGSTRVRLAALLDGGEASVEKFVNRETPVTVCGWSRSVRKQGGGSLCFVVLSDGSTSSNLQVVVEAGIGGEFPQLLKCGAGCSFRFTGDIVKSPAKGQAVELAVRDPSKGHRFEILGMTDAAKYPLAKKEHTREYLREIAHLRPRSYLIGAVMRVRSNLAMATHRFFQDRGFLYIHTPIVTASDCEGAGEMFQVSTLLPPPPPETRENEKKTDGAAPKDAAAAAAEPLIPLTKDKKGVDYSRDFFGRPAFLTVSGQLAVEPYCCSLSDVYTFGPTFRAENSHTSRHLAEFWMVEPEIAFATLEDNMVVAEAYVKFCVQWVLDNCRADIEWFQKNQEEGLIARLENILAEPFARVSYTEAIEVLKAEEPKAQFKEKVEWGMDMGSEHERYLTENVYKKPCIVYNYPKDIKAFYMKLNEDGKTVRAMDVLVPKIGELVGGSQREDDRDRLAAMIAAKDLDPKPYWWYMELREYGTIPHAGFGLGFERLVMLVTGIENIRDTIPYPRYPGHAEF